MNILNFVKSASPEANKLVIYSSSLLLIKLLIFNNYPAPFSVFYTGGNIFEAILASVIASYVFYLLAVHAKEISDRRILQPYLETYFQKIVQECTTQIANISYQSKINLELETLTFTQIQAAFGELHPLGPAPLSLGNRKATWLEYLQHHAVKTQGHIRKLMAQLPYLQPGEITKITDIEECHHFNIMTLLTNLPIRNDDMSAFAKSFYDYCKLCELFDEKMLSHIPKPKITPSAPGTTNLNDMLRERNRNVD
ncbi:hypothetical protein KDX38_08525 [Pseudomonas sp. CDFA 602]|uniref:hypothetical protein n=1 Tax=Pseudomonas californiensis TaxID=2829823 RepID=UPI001E37830E|nr:hypothetical protein [Pseudomonas californiensis]MCD5993665.1 hypothetical protein [Pseudomonas californiensis]MCD5999260.1 hypothetical protein [Pseudomonas californiensis]